MVTADDEHDGHDDHCDEQGTKDLCDAAADSHHCEWHADEGACEHEEEGEAHDEHEDEHEGHDDHCDEQGTKDLCDAAADSHHCEWHADEGACEHEEEDGSGHDGHDDHEGHDDHAAQEPCSCQAEEDGWTIDCTDAGVVKVQTAFAELEADGCDASEAACDADSHCQVNYRILQAHHDHCPHDTLPEELEKHFHDFEDTCKEHGCVIARQFVEDSEECPTVDCENQVAMQSAADALVGCETDCTSTKCSLAFKTVHSFHDFCEHEDLENTAGNAIEKNIHDYEDVCSEESACNVVPQVFDPNICDGQVKSGAAGVAASLFAAAAMALCMLV